MVGNSPVYRVFGAENSLIQILHRNEIFGVNDLSLKDMVPSVSDLNVLPFCRTSRCVDSQTEKQQPDSTEEN